MSELTAKQNASIGIHSLKPERNRSILIKLIVLI